MLKQSTFGVFLIISKLINVLCFNYDTRAPIVYEKFEFLNERNSYFGFSVILSPGYAENMSWIQIGAPRSANPGIKNSMYPGLVYRCGIKNVCRQLPVDNGSDDFERVYKFKNRWVDSWLGGTMDISYEYNKSVICAHRWSSSDGTYNDFGMQGACYWCDENNLEKTFKSFNKELPLVKKDQYYTARSQNSIYYHKLGQAGMSAHFSKNADLTLGAPGIYNWNGGAISYGEENINFYDTFRAERAAQQGELKEISSGMTESSLKYFYGLFGYSMTSGCYFSRNNILYAGGSPRSNKMFGQVLIFSFSKRDTYDKNTYTIKTHDVKVGSQIGEYFGASVTSGDINNDGLDDLIVGASMYKLNDGYNEGKVYVFLGNKDGELKVPETGNLILGSQVGGQFGTTVAFLNDIDGDHFGDVAVSAPYEDHGVVYVYRGSAKGIIPVPSQKIEGQHFSPNIKGFGISISKPADIDNNGYKDIAIGAYKSGHVVLLRAQPIAKINHTLEANTDKILVGVNNIWIKACFKYSSIRGPTNIEITRKITVDSALGRASLLNNPINKTISLSINKNFCENLNIRLKVDNIDRTYPLTIELSHSIVQRSTKEETVFVSNQVQGSDQFCASCVVYDRFSSSPPLTLSIPFSLGCRNTHICHSFLEFSPEFITYDLREGERKNVYKYVRGSTDEIHLSTKITNRGENAYSGKLIVILPEFLGLRALPTSCAQSAFNLTNIITCDVENPMRENASKILNLELDMKSLNNKFDISSLNIVVKVKTSSENRGENSKIKTLELVTEADMSITGKSEEETYLFDPLNQDTVAFKQTLEIAKYGTSPVEKVLTEIQFVFAFQTENGETHEIISLYEPTAYLGTQPLKVESNIAYIKDEYSLGDDSNFEISEKSLNQTGSKNNKNVAYLEKNTEVLYTGDDNLLEFNCNGKNSSLCGKLSINSGPFTKENSIAFVELNFVLNVANFRNVINNRNVTFSTYGRISILSPRNFTQSGKRRDSVVVTSSFGKISKGKVASWIIAASIGLGLLCILLLILLLLKCGFFKRKLNEKRQQEQQAVQEQKEIIEHTQEEEGELNVESFGIYDDKLENNPL